MSPIFFMLQYFAFMTLSRSIRVTMILMFWALAAAPTLAQGPWHEGFEGGQVSWRMADSDVRYQKQQHQRVQKRCSQRRGV